MLTHIKIFSKKFDCPNLKPCTIDENIYKKLISNDYKPIKINEIDTSDCAITNEDTVICGIVNTEEISYIQFYLLSDTDIKPYINHDIYFDNTITCIDFVEFHENTYIVLITFNNFIYFYDCLMYNPLTPQILIECEEIPLYISVIDNVLYSLHKDHTIRSWNIEEKKNTALYKLDDLPNSFYIKKDVLVLVFDNKIKFNSKEINFNDNIVDCVFRDNSFVICTVKGSVFKYDYYGICFNSFDFEQKNIKLFQFSSDNYVIFTEEGLILVFDCDLKLLTTKKRKNQVFCAEFTENNRLLYGGTESIKILNF